MLLLLRGSSSRGGARSILVVAALVMGLASCASSAGNSRAAAPTTEVLDATASPGTISGSVNDGAGSQTPVTTTVPLAENGDGSATPGGLPSGQDTTVPAQPVVWPLSKPIAVPLDQDAAEPVIDIGTIEIPKLGVSERLYEGIRLTTFDRGPGHWPGTAMPGQFGNAVIGGHRTSHTRPFRHLDALVPGDVVIFTSDAGRYEYLVDSTEIIAPNFTQIVNQNPGFTATLFACNPPGSTKERIVVHLVLSSS